MANLLRLVSTIAWISFATIHMAFAQASTEDPGAGPVTGRLTKCLIAHHQGHDEVCPEPTLAPDHASRSKRVASRLARANYYIEIQQLEKALSETDAAIAADPDNAGAHHLAARLLMILGDTERLQREVILARKQAPNDPAIRVTYAIMLQGRQGSFESLKELQAIVSSHPHYLFAREQLALLLMRLGQSNSERRYYEAALAQYDFIIRQSRPDPNLLARRAEALLASGEPKTAASDLTEALKLDPDRSDLLLARANAYVVAEMDERAVSDFNLLLAITDGTPRYPLPENDRAVLLTKRANAFVRLHRFGEAADDVIAALNFGGARAVLRAQVFLRGNGFPNTPIDGKDSPTLRESVRACFGLNACFQGIMQSI
jgi:Tfp pilus assembly protein PilF